MNEKYLSLSNKKKALNIPKARYRDFLVTFHNPAEHGFAHPVDYLEFIKNIPNIESRLKYLVFQWEITPEGKTSQNHYQMYFEYINNMSIQKIQNDFFLNRKVNVKPRAGLAEEAINYCSNQGGEQKERVIEEYFEYGSPKRTYSTLNRKNTDIPFNFKEQIIHISEEVKNKKYTSLKDIEKDYPVLRFTHSNLLQSILNAYQQKKVKPLPARVIWIFGEAGTGKTVWTQKYLREIGYKYWELTEISPPSMIYGEHVWFRIEDQFKKVLIINEADREFPKRNNLIAWIDRVEQLDVKNNQKIDNNYELIVINSIYRPEEVFRFLGKQNAKQVLRRIFNSHTNSEVYELLANYEQLELVKKKAMADDQFAEWYTPTVRKIENVDWTFFDSP